MRLRVSVAPYLRKCGNLPIREIKLILDQFSCPRIWNIEKEKDRDKEKVGDRPAKLNEKKSDRELSRARDKKQRRHFLSEEQHENL